MPTKIGLISDIHATPAPLAEALGIFRQHGVDHILCAGDTGGYGTELESTVELLRAAECESVIGNHDLWLLEKGLSAQAGDYLGSLPVVLERIIEGQHLYMVHASPPRSLMDGIRLLDEGGRVIAAQRDKWSRRLRGLAADILLVGHTHQVFAERLGDVLVVNPGSSCFNHSCAVLTLPAMSFEIFPLSGKKVLRTWNWGMLRRTAAAD